MWIPLAVGLAMIGFMLGRSKKGAISVGENRERVGAKYVLDTPRRQPTPLEILKHFLARRIRPSEQLVAAACQQAYDMGNYDLVDAIVKAYEHSCQSQHPHASEAPASPPAPAPATPDAPASAADQSVPPAPGPRSLKSPIEGVSDDEWSNFAAVMKTDDPTFETDRHLGAYHQRKDRLSKLSLSPGKDEDSQYEAFVADCLDHMRQKKLIYDNVAAHVEVNGETHVVSVSGFLGLMKVAGPQNAVHWINNPEDQKNFPKTTEVFLRCNNCF